MSNTVQKGRIYIGTGLAGIALAAAYVMLGAQLPFGQMDQPGAAVFPMVVGAILAFASLSAIFEGWRMPPGESIELPTGANLWRLLGLMGLFIGYIVLLPLLGQIITSVLFSIATLRFLSAMSWPRILLGSAIMALLLNAFFIGVFNVPLPRGPWAFW